MNNEKQVLEAVTLKIPKQMLEFAEFYAEIGDEERDALLTKILTERLSEMKALVKALPHLDIPELY